MLGVIIFSKNRAAQLDLMLRTMRRYSKWMYDAMPVVVYKSDNDHEKSYMTLESEHNILAINQYERTLNETLSTEINELVDSKYTHVLFFTDDNIFINHFSEEYYNYLISIYTENVHAISLRMHKDITFCAPANKSMKQPKIISLIDYFTWDWQEEGIDQHTCWGYPTSINSHIYRLEYIDKCVKRWYNKGNVNDLEAHLNRNRDKTKRIMIGTCEQIIYDTMQNTVRAGNGYNTDMVGHYLKQYSDGKRIDIDSVHILRNDSAHGQVTFKWC